jgi:hypothetical protein
MKKDEFVKIRKRAGKKAEEYPSQPCLLCKEPVNPIRTRENPDAFLVFSDEQAGELHSCRKSSADAR